MKFNKFYILTLLVLSFPGFCTGQADMSVAHVRMINTQVFGAIDMRMPAFMIRPEIDIKLLNARLEFGGLYNFSVANLESWYQGEILNYKNSLVGENLGKPYGGNEIWIGGNFINHYNPDATIISARTLGPWTIYSSNSGTRVIQFGGHIGLGSNISKTNIYDHGFNLEGEDNKVYSVNDNYPNSVYRFDTYANVNINYTFLGIHSCHVSKISDRTNTVWGGSSFKYYLDLIFPTKVTIDDMYSASSDRYMAIPKEGDDWKKMGYRIGMKRWGTGTVSSSVKLELGKMTSFSSVDPGPQSFYFMIGVGVGISPKIGAYEFD